MDAREETRIRHAAMLRSYLSKTEIGQKDFGKLCGVTQSNVALWLGAKRRIPPERARMIERATAGRISAKALYPELF